MNRFVCLIVLLVVATGSVHGQVDIERLRPEDTSGTTGTVDFDLTIRRGNVDLFELGPALSVAHGTDRFALLVLGSGDLGWEGGERFSNEALGHIRLQRVISPVLGWEAFAQINYDKSRLLDFRALGGLGIRVQKALPEMKLSVGSAYMLEHEQNDIPAGALHPDETNVHRWSSYVSLSRSLSETAEVSATGYLQPDLADLGDYRALVDARLSARVVRSVSLTTSVGIHYDSTPVDGIASSDFELSTGLSLEW